MARETVLSGKKKPEHAGQIQGGDGRFPVPETGSRQKKGFSFPAAWPEVLSGPETRDGGALAEETGFRSGRQAEPLTELFRKRYGCFGFGTGCLFAVLFSRLKTTGMKRRPALE